MNSLQFSIVRVVTLAIVLAPLACYGQYRVLLTSEDGHDSDGIQTLRGALASAGYQVTVVAPLTSQAGKGTALFSDVAGQLKVQRQEASGGWSVDGTPTDAVRVGLEVLNLRPDIVISGIHFGESLGPAVNSSSTVGAAVWAVSRGVSAIAVSAGVNAGEAASGYPSTRSAMQRAAALVVNILRKFREEPAIPNNVVPYNLALNINYPATGAPLGPIVTPLSRNPGTSESRLVKDQDFDESGNVVLRITPSAPLNRDPSFRSDTDLFRSGYITVSPIDADWGSDLVGLRIMQGQFRGLFPDIVIF